MVNGGKFIVLNFQKVILNYTEEISVRKNVIVVLLLAVMVVPVGIVQVIPTDSPQPYVFQARIRQKLDETLQGQLQYFLVDRISGEAPAAEFVVLIDQAYSRGYTNVKFEVDQEFWGQGSLMTPEVFYGEQYLFFEHPQIYVSQIKGSLLWPDQVTELKILYLAPLTSILAPLYMVRYPFMEEFTLTNYLTILVQTLVLAATIVLIIKKRENPEAIVTILLAYALVTIIVIIPMLTDLY
jgi:hypothetical protein